MATAHLCSQGSYLLQSPILEGQGIAALANPRSWTHSQVAQLPHHRQRVEPVLKPLVKPLLKTSPETTPENPKADSGDAAADMGHINKTVMDVGNRTQASALIASQAHMMGAGAKGEDADLTATAGIAHSH